MNALRIVGVLLIVGGMLGLAYGGFSYSKETAGARIGPLELSVKERQGVNVPVWGSVAFIVLGGGLLVWGRRKP
ncbi:MAG: hypothetical protein KA141_06330 [Rubrivivax sp.]|jgi:hypothetical protein|nr:hypothetical protein [Rubrivivax sp.]